MVYNAYNIPIYRVVLLFETRNLRYLSNVWIPKFLLIWSYKRFIKLFNEWFNEKDNKDLNNLVNEWYLTKLKNKQVNLLPSLYMGLAYSSDKRASEIYEKHFGKYTEQKEALKRVLDEIKRIGDKLDVENLNEQEEKKGYTFSETIGIIESARGIPISRNMTLFDFKQIYHTEIENGNREH